MDRGGPVEGCIFEPLEVTLACYIYSPTVPGSHDPWAGTLWAGRKLYLSSVGLLGDTSLVAIGEEGVG